MSPFNKPVRCRIWKIDGQWAVYGMNDKEGWWIKDCATWQAAIQLVDRIRNGLR